MEEEIRKWSRKRLVQTSEPYECTLDALDSAEAALQFDFCDYAYVDSYNRVVAIFSYDDTHHDYQIQKNQELVLIPHYKHQRVQTSMGIKDQITKMAESIGLRWSNANDLGRIAEKIIENNPDAELKTSASTGYENGEFVTELTFSIKIKQSSLRD